MLQHQSQVLPLKKRVSNKLIAGLAAFLTTGIITASSFAGATASNPNKPPTPADCKKAGHSTMEECQAAWKVKLKQNNHQVNTIGHGYGGGNTSVAANINVGINGNNNIVEIVFNIFR